MSAPMSIVDKLTIAAAVAKATWLNPESPLTEAVFRYLDDRLSDAATLADGGDELSLAFMFAAEIRLADALIGVDA